MNNVLQFCAVYIIFLSYLDFSFRSHNMNLDKKAFAALAICLETSHHPRYKIRLCCGEGMYSLPFPEGKIL